MKYYVYGSYKYTPLEFSERYEERYYLGYREHIVDAMAILVRIPWKTPIKWFIIRTEHMILIEWEDTENDEKRESTEGTSKVHCAEWRVGEDGKIT